MYATCETTGCGNSGIPLEVPADTVVICGVCSNRVTTLAVTKPDTPTEVPLWLS